MQIHELPAGSPASGLQFAGDTGTQTQKIDYDALADAILNKLTTKTFNIKSESQTIIAALNALGDASKQDVANDLVTTAAGLVLDARQGKALDDKIASLNSSIAEKIMFVGLAVPTFTAKAGDTTVTVECKRTGYKAFCIGFYYYNSNTSWYVVNKSYSEVGTATFGFVNKGSADISVSNASVIWLLIKS
jgi:hypothetical protein